MNDRHKEVGKGCLVVVVPFTLGSLAYALINYLIQTYCS
jgi:hypothetical protein